MYTKRDRVMKKSFISELFRDYCSNTTIHGISYMGAKDKTLFEKIWWVIVFAVSFTICAILINKTWNKWNTSPVIVSFAQEQMPIWKVPFPAVTICPINKIAYSNYDYTQKFLNRANFTGDEYKKFWDISLLCKLDFYEISENGSPNTTDEGAIENIIQVAPRMREIIKYVFWQYKLMEIEDFFSETLTEEGLCFTSNFLRKQDLFTDELKNDIKWINHNRENKGWTTENGYPSGTNIDTYPRRTAQDGYMAGLGITIGTEYNEMNRVCGFPVSGYKIILHNPAEISKPKQQYILVPFDKQVAITVSPQLITTSIGLLSVPPKTRKCYFFQEKSLKFFRVYTQNNCKAECFGNMTKEFCGCVPFYLPRENGTKICGYGRTQCTALIEKKIMDFEMMQKDNGLPKVETDNKEYEIYQKCDCLPSCSSLQFNTESSSADLHISETIKLSKEAGNGMDERLVEMVLNKKIALTQVDIFFKDTQFLALHRSELYGPTDFLANCGGLLGLFMGFSVLSLLEIVYYLTIRVYCKVRQNNQIDTTL